jgi:shikimate dehydrogenase
VSARAITGATAVYGVVGDPIAHSLSPALHAAAFDALGVDAVSVALRAGADAAMLAVGSVRELGILGLSVTMPLKAPIVEHCDERSPVVERLGACNCLVRTGRGDVRAESTDGAGLLDAIRCVSGRGVDGARCVVVGAGGAARAAIDALANAGAREVLVVARRPEAVASACSLATVAAPGTTSSGADADLVVNATPIGMLDTDTEHVDPLVDGATLGAGQLAVDLVYHPRVTRWLERAASAGATTVPGVEVLVHQAAGALHLWLGTDVPVDPLHAVAGRP